MEWDRVLKALMFGLVTAITPFAVKGAEAVPHRWEDLVVLVAVALIASYGKYSSSTTLVAPNRTNWDAQVRAAKLYGGGNR